MLGKYPVHWHDLGNATGMYIRNSVIWRSYNRCITVHCTDGIQINSNTCYDHIGHGIFLESGAEEENIINKNLVKQKNHFLKLIGLGCWNKRVHGSVVFGLV